MSRSLVTSQPPALAPPLLSISPTGLSQLSPLQALAPAAVPPRSDSLHASTSTLNPSPHTAPTQFNPPTPYPSFPNSVYPALATLTLDDTSHAPSASTETLPRYSRRAATSASAEDDPPLKEFALQSKSRKMSLRFMAAGEANPVLVQPEPDARTWLKGSLVLTLPSSEPVAYIKIRLKGVVRTMVMKVHGSGRHPVTDEVTIWEDATTVYSRESSSQPQDINLSTSPNLSSDPSRLQGTLTFPFALQIPARVVRPGAAGVAGRRMRPPPSFLLGSVPDQAGAALGAEWASCRYMIKVTLGRRGLLKTNERWVTPVVFVPRQNSPAMSDARMLALAGGLPVPGPLEDPEGWAGKRVVHPVKRGNVLRGIRHASYEVTLLLPAPAKVARTAAVPFALRLASTDPDATTRFPKSGVSVFLLQRTHIGAQGLASTHDLVVGRANLVEDGPEEGIELGRREGGDETQLVWGKRYQGQIKMSKSVGSSFKAPNLTVSFLVGVYVSVPGSGNDAEVFVPIEILSSLRAGVAQASDAVAPTPAHLHSALSFARTPDTSRAGTPPLAASAAVQSALVSDTREPSGGQEPVDHAGSPGGLDLAHPAAAGTGTDTGTGASTAAIAIPLPSPSLLHGHGTGLGGPPPPTWAESVSPETPGGWLSMPPSYFASELVRVEEEVGSPAEEGRWG